MTRRQVAVLISGRGSNMEALIRAAQAPDYPAEIGLVLSDRREAEGLAKARQAGIRAELVDHAGFLSRQAFEAALQDRLDAHRIEFVALAGFMRLLSAGFVERWTGRIINIHPSLLPAFKGLDTHRRALEAGVPMHGCTVHHVTSGMDEGPIIAQAKVPVWVGDTAETLGARVLAEEHALYPIALARLLRGEAAAGEGEGAF